MKPIWLSLLLLPYLASAQTTVGGGGSSSGGGLEEAIGAGFKITPRSEFGAGHSQIPLARGKYAIPVFARNIVTSKSGKQADISGMPLRFETGGCPSCIDVEFKAAISPVPGGFNVPDACKIRRVDNDGPNQMKALSTITVMVDPSGSPAPEAGSRRAAYLKQYKKPMEEGKFCLLKPGKVYYYNIAGGCDWELIKRREANGRNYTAAQKNSCTVRLIKGSEGMLTHP